MTTDEVLAVGSERERLSARPRRWARRRRWWLVGAAVVVVLLVVLDQWQQRREMDALLAEVTAGEQAIGAANGSLQVVVDYYSPVVFRANAPDEVRSGMRTDLARAATEGALDVRAASTAAGSVSVLPWHRSLREARAYYVARTDAWGAYLEAVAAEPYAIFRPANDGLPSTIRPRLALERAAPWGYDVASRVDVLLAP